MTITQENGYWLAFGRITGKPIIAEGDTRAEAGRAWIELAREVMGRKSC